ncbi:hypothetical protein ACQE98_02630 [Ornithinimicrobium sp. W1679]|uniref:hypothetical protein n=1 Tax=unclassified Ornithinimicrobium TaxID=2615080 RepID=UPI003CFB4767
MGTLTALGTLRGWSARRWSVAVATAVATAVFIGVPTDLVPNPVFGRDVPVTWWAWPSLVVSSVLAGLLTATYVRSPVAPDAPEAERSRRRGLAGGLLTFFAVGCPVCNKLVLLALGYAGAMTWFQPVQPVLQVLAVALLALALVQRLRGELACAVPTTSERTLRA